MSTAVPATQVGIPGTSGGSRPESSPAGSESARRRNLALDGVRGVTVVLVVLGHLAGDIFPDSALMKVPVLAGFFRGGSVTVFFVVGGYLVTEGLLRAAEQGRLDAVLFYLRRVVRLWAQLIPLVLVVVLLAWWDPQDPFSAAQTKRSVLSALFFTTDHLYVKHVFDARDDLGHLWYLSVIQQLYLVLPLFVLLTFRRRLWALVPLVAGIVAAGWYREHLDATLGWYEAGLNSLARMDGPLLGVLIAYTAALWRGRTRFGDVALWVGVASWLGLLAVSREMDRPLQLGWWGEAALLMAAVVVLGIVAGSPDGPLAKLFSNRVLVTLGRASLVIYLWHFVILRFLLRHSENWGPLTLTAATLVLLAAVTWLGVRFIENPIRAWLATHLRTEATGGSR